MTTPARPDAAPAMRSPFVRWLVLLLMALDLLSAPLHAHAHDFGPASLATLAHVVAGALPHAEAPPAAGMGHSVAALRVADRSDVDAPDLATLVACIALLAPGPAAAVAVVPPTAQDPVPIGGRHALRPEGRAPPVLHA